MEMKFDCTCSVYTKHNIELRDNCNIKVCKMNMKCVGGTYYLQITAPDEPVISHRSMTENAGSTL